MSIGNSINSLPLAYAPLTGMGRYVAYALANPAAEATVTPLASFIADAGVVLAGAGYATPVGLRIAPAFVTGATTSATSFSGVRSFFGALLALVGAELSGEGIKVKNSAAIAALAALAATGATSLRIRQGACDFTSVYIPPGERSSGHVLNSFALNLASLNSKAGQFRHVIEALCSPRASFIASPSISIKADTVDQSPTGNAFFGGFFAPVVAAGISPLPNAIFNPNPILTGAGGFTPFGVALRATGATFAQDSASAVVLGNFIAGPSKTLTLISASAFTPSVIFAPSLGVNITSILAAIAKLMAGGALSMDGLAAMVMAGSRMRIGYVDPMSALTTMAGAPWDPRAIIESIIYADAWDSDLGAVVAENTVYLTDLDSIVYKSDPESIVYGELD